MTQKHAKIIRLIGYFSVTVALHFLMAIGCISRNAISIDELKVRSSPQAKPAQEALQFRSLLYHFAKEEMSHSEFLRTALVPDEALYEPHQTNFASIVEHFRKYKPETFYQRSLQHLPLKIAKLKKINLPPMTLIVIPGAFSEVANGTIFPEAVDNRNSSFARWANKKYATAKPAYKVDKHYLLSEMQEVEAPLDELVRWGSIDDEEGNAMVNVIFLFPPFGALESFGNVEDHYPYYKRRLDKVFSIIGRQPRIYISGHSRGAPIAMDLIARIAKDKSANDWAKNILGFIGLDGALFGIHFADAYFNPALPAYQFHKTMVELSMLDESNNIFTSMRNRSRIVDSLLPTLKEFLFDRGYKNEPGVYFFPDLTAGLKLARDFEEQLAARSYFGDYKSHIRRVKIVAAAVDACLLSLSHKERIKWWKNNTIPTNIRYYTVSSTLPSPVVAKKMNPLQRALFESPMMQRKNLDYAILRGISYDYYSDKQVSLNDGPVGVHEGTMWPQLHRKLNPKQEPYESHVLGLFAVHHFGLPYASTATDGIENENPFPRRAFLKALAYYMASVETSSGKKQVQSFDLASQNHRKKRKASD
jgi:hypothetical protein